MTSFSMVMEAKTIVRGVAVSVTIEHETVTLSDGSTLVKTTTTILCSPGEGVCYEVSPQTVNGDTIISDGNGNVISQGQLINADFSNNTFLTHSTH